MSSEQLPLFTIQQSERTSNDYYTPRWIFDALGTRFDLDVACPPEGPLFTPCDRFLTQKEDGLSAPWEGFVWMNPPYSNPTPWVARFIEHNNGIALLPASNGKWSFRLWDVCDGWLPLRAVKFHTATGLAKGCMPLPVYLVAMGLRAKGVLMKCGLGKVR